MRDPKWVAIVSFHLHFIINSDYSFDHYVFLPPEYNVKALLLEPSPLIVSPTSGL